MKFSRQHFLSLGGGAVTVLAGCSGGAGISAVSGLSAAKTTTVATMVPATATPASAVAVSVGSQTISQAIPAGFAGLSYEKAKIAQKCFTSSNISLMGCFRLIGPSLMRIGGNTVDTTTWQATGAGSITGQVAPADITALGEFLQSVGWRVVYGINLATNTPAGAADEASYAATILGNSLYGFEIGNEPDLYSKNGIRTSDYNLDDFISEWSSYAAAIRQSVPNVPLTAPACSSSIASWTVPFAATINTEIELLTQHYYRGGPSPNSTISLLLSGDPNLPQSLGELQAAASTNSIPGGYRITECNSYYDGGIAGVSDAYGTALWAIDFMMIAAQHGAVGVNFHGGGDGPGYTPIADDNTSVVGLRPVFYGMVLFGQIAPGPLLPVFVSTSLLLTAYAVAGNDGATYVIIINKDPSVPAATTVSLAKAATSAVPIVLSGTGLTSTTGTMLANTTIGNKGGFVPIPNPAIPVTAESLTLTVAAASAVLLKIT